MPAYPDSFITFAKERALDRLYDEHGRHIAPGMTKHLRRIIHDELVKHGPLTEAGIAKLGHWAIDIAVQRFGLEMLCKPRKEK